MICEVQIGSFSVKVAFCTTVHDGIPAKIMDLLGIRKKYMTTNHSGTIRHSSGVPGCLYHVKYHFFKIEIFDIVAFYISFAYC